MNLKKILEKKTVSVWGLGYLAYTTMLKLQNSGFNIAVYDINEVQMKEFLSGSYPDRKKVAHWSHIGYVPQLDYSRIMLVRDPKELFKFSDLHIMAVPAYYDKTSDENATTILAKIFAKNIKKSKEAPFIIFESASAPGHIEKYFAGYLKENKLACSKDYFLGAWFRTDWSVEAFLSQKEKTPVAGCSRISAEAIEELFKYLGIDTVKLGTLKEAEIYINSMNAIQSMVNDFVRQLSVGYPSVNMKEVSETLFKNVTLENCKLNMGTGGTQMTYAIDYLIEGSDNPEDLTLLKEFQDINISSVLKYGEYIIRHGYKSATILGISYKGNQKDITLSPAVTLADYLVKNSVRVMLNDPLCIENEIRKLVSGVEATSFPAKTFSTDVLILTSDHSDYKYLSQSMLDKVKKKTKLIIDNYGIWSHLSFGSKIKYHRIGDGSLNLLG